MVDCCHQRSGSSRNEPGSVRVALAGANPVGGEGMVLALAFNTIEPITVEINQALALLSKKFLKRIIRWP
jgi:hypothetical protein